MDPSQSAILKIPASISATRNGSLGDWLASIGSNINDTKSKSVTSSSI